MSRIVIFYILVMAFFGSLIWLVFYQGGRLDQPASPLPITNEPRESINWAYPETAVAVFFKKMSRNVAQPLSLLLLQVITIVLLSKFLGALVGKIGQPRVIGEIMAGILLGPSIVGQVWPGLSEFLFRAESLPNLGFLSQLGLILFMFIIGLELDSRLLKNKADTAIVVSHASIIIPFAMGVCLAYFLYEAYAPPHISFLAFGLFIGIAMSITAFPVLARILQERGLTQTPLGSLAITCAAADDITAWCVLAAVIAIVQADTLLSVFFTVALSLLYIFIMLKLVRPWIERIGARYTDAAGIDRSSVVLCFMVLFTSALATEVIGIHALFGAFLAGACMPAANEFRKSLAVRIEDVSLVILLPLLFAFTGLKTQIGLLNEGMNWLICCLIILVAVAGKFGGSLFAARFTGQSWSDSIAIGALMNTRGLMELIVLNIGYDLGVLSPTIFTMLVLMALVTTFMTSPLLSAIQYLRWKRELTPVSSSLERV